MNFFTVNLVIFVVDLVDSIPFWSFNLLLELIMDYTVDIEELKIICIFERIYRAFFGFDPSGRPNRESMFPNCYVSFEQF